MTERTYTTIDKSKWNEGPWMREPDKIQWIDKETDLDCLIVRNRMGALCGYVGVGPDHPFHSRSYDDLLDLDVHGGLTFSGSCDEDKPESEGICHVPMPGRSAAIWWLGFDCAHGYDLVPTMQLFGCSSTPGDVYRNVEYVRNECANLAKQLVDNV